MLRSLPMRTVFNAADTVRSAANKHIAAAAAAAAVATVAASSASSGARSFSHSSNRFADNNKSNSSSSSSSYNPKLPNGGNPYLVPPPLKKAPQQTQLPLPPHVQLQVPAGKAGMDQHGHWHEEVPTHDTFKEAMAKEIYSNAEVRGSGFIKPEITKLNHPLTIHGMGVPSPKQTQPRPPRRSIMPHSVQDVPTPMKTYTKGPREMGFKVVRTFIGHVTSDKMQKTIAVEVSQFYRHPKYHKYIKTSKKFLAHDEAEECNVGDVVEIRVCRPLSKRKHFTLHRIIKPKLDIDDAAKLFEIALPPWQQQPGTMTKEQVEKEHQEELDDYEQALADEEAEAAIEAQEPRERGERGGERKVKGGKAAKAKA